MRIVDCEQGSPEWIAARLGIPTASNFDQLITKTGKPSASADRYVAKLCAEWFLGQPIDDYQGQWMERGTRLEENARDYYEFDTDQTVRTVGFCLRDDGKAGASPDSLVGDDGLLEIKCPSAEIQMMYRLGGMPQDYFIQVQGQLWITGRKWCDLLAFNPALPKVKVRYERDEKFIDLIAEAVDAAVTKLDRAKELLAGEKAARDEAQREAMAATADDHPF